MYTEFYALERKPFEQLPDPRFLYLSDQHDQALSSIQFALAVQDSFVVITGEIGSGKTTLLKKVLQELGHDLVVAHVTHTRLNGVQLLQAILVEFGFQPFRNKKVELITMLRDFITEQHRAGKQVIIVVDEAQNLGPEVLEELRLLTCLDTEEGKLLNVVLVGQPQLSRMIDSAELEQLRQRCRLRFHLPGLTRKQTEAYMRHRVSVAGGSYDKIFESGIEAFVHKHTGGIPRLINTLCDTALVFGCVEEVPRIGAGILEQAIAELNWPKRGYRKKQIVATADDVAKAGRGIMTVEERGRPVSRVIIDEPQTLIGRASDCGIHIDSRYLSRRHAILTREGKRWAIADLNSTNGTFVNGQRIRKHLLQPGDVISIGNHSLIFSALEDLVQPEDTGKRPGGESAFTETTVLGDEGEPEKSSISFKLIK